MYVCINECYICVPCLFQLSYEFFLISVQLSPKKKYTFYFSSSKKNVDRYIMIILLLFYLYFINRIN